MKKVLAVLLMAAMVLGLTACGNSADTPAAGSSAGTETTAGGNTKAEENAELPVLRVSFHNDYISLPLAYALYNNLDEQYGFKMEVSTFVSGAAQNEALGSDSWDVGVIGSAFAVSCYTYGAYMIGDYIQGADTVAVFARADSDIAAATGANAGYPDILGNADTVRGKTVLVSTGGTQYSVFVAYLNAIGLTIDDVNIVEMDSADAYSAWLSGEGDIFPTVGPYSTRLLLNNTEDTTEVASMTTLGMKQYDVCVASKSAYEDKHDLVVKFMEMVYDCNDILAQDLDLSAQIYKQWEEENGITITEEEAMFECKIRPLLTTEDINALIEEGFGEYEQMIVDLDIASGVFPEDLQKIMDGQVTSDVMKAAISK